MHSCTLPFRPTELFHIYPVNIGKRQTGPHHIGHDNTAASCLTTSTLLGAIPVSLEAKIRSSTRGKSGSQWCDWRREKIRSHLIGDENFFTIVKRISGCRYFLWFNCGILKLQRCWLLSPQSPSTPRLMGLSSFAA